ncbi:type IX secretion system membrane protein PorP/SprF, partial [candidate division KSB1 bacterium]|nr:type IX secretion system membrane protein PorP/SprF [candidate division KSB1 bacterium]
MQKMMMLVWFWVIAWSALGFSQSGLISNASNILDPRIMFSNPAGPGFWRYSLLVAGNNQYYVGIDHDQLNQIFLGMSYPIRQFGSVSLTGQFFKSDVLRKNWFEINYAVPLWAQRLSIGVKVGLLHLDYDHSNFNLVDIDDPLLNHGLSKNSLNLGAGLLMNPLSNVYFGVSLNHLNRPNLSLAGNQMPTVMTTNFSLMYDHWLFRPLLSLETENQTSYLNLGLEKWFLNDQAMLRGMYTPQYLALSAAYNFKKIRFDYEYQYALSDLNLVTSGFHQLMMSYKFRQEMGDFAISVTPLEPNDPVTPGVYPTQNASFLVEILPRHNFHNLVSLKVTGLPENMQADFSPRKIIPGERTIFHIRILRNCQPNLYALKVKGTSGLLARSTAFALKIRPLPLIRPEIQSLTDTLFISEIRKIQDVNPIVNQIFFHEGDHQLYADRYQILNPEQTPVTNFIFFPERITDFSEQYRNVLNVLAKRLRENLNFRITVVGCNCDWGPEKNNFELSRARALSVKNYLVKNCGVTEEQIIVTA